MLEPVVILDASLDKAMAPDHDLKTIVDDIVNIIFLGDDGTESPNLFYIKGKK